MGRSVKKSQPASKWPLKLVVKRCSPRTVRVHYYSDATHSFRVQVLLVVKVVLSHFSVVGEISYRFGGKSLTLTESSRAVPWTNRTKILSVREWSLIGSHCIVRDSWKKPSRFTRIRRRRRHGTYLFNTRKHTGERRTGCEEQAIDKEWLLTCVSGASRYPAWRGVFVSVYECLFGKYDLVKPPKI